MVQEPPSRTSAVERTAPLASTARNLPAAPPSQPRMATANCRRSPSSGASHRMVSPATVAASASGMRVKVTTHHASAEASGRWRPVGHPLPTAGLLEHRAEQQDRGGDGVVAKERRTDGSRQPDDHERRQRDRDGLGRTPEPDPDGRTLPVRWSAGFGESMAARALSARPGSPDATARRPRRPHLVQQRVVAQRVHRLPETGVTVGHQLPGTTQALQRLARGPPGGRRRGPPDAPAIAHEITTVDEASVVWGFSLNSVTASLAMRISPSVRWPHRRHGQSDFAVCFVEGDQLADVDVGYRASPYVRRNGSSPSRYCGRPPPVLRHRVRARFGEGDGPVLLVGWPRTVDRAYLPERDPDGGGHRPVAS